jgi:hypothetical protein
MVVVKPINEVPRDATHWLTCTVAKSSGLSQAAVQRIGRALGLQPHFKQPDCARLPYPNAGRSSPRSRSRMIPPAARTERWFHAVGP